MADSVKERILKHVETTLAGLVPGTFAAVKRFSSVNLSYVSTPLAILHQGDDRLDHESAPLVHRTLTVSVVIIARLDATETRSDDEVLNDLEKKVIEQMAIDETRNGLAVTTRHIFTSPIPVEEGQPESSVLLDFEIPFRHRIGSPELVG